MGIIRTVPSCSRCAKPWTILRAGNGESGMTSRNGFPVLITLSTFSITSTLDGQFPILPFV